MSRVYPTARITSTEPALGAPVDCYLPVRSRCLHPGQQQGRRWPSSSSSLVRRIRRSRVISCFASSTQQMNSLRASGVMSFQASSAVELAVSASRRSPGSWCTAPPGTRGVLTPSAFGKVGKITLGLPIPTHAFDGLLPPALHLPQGTFVRRVTAGDHLFEMTVLRLDDLVGGRSLMRSVTRPTKLLTRHGLHDSRFLSLCLSVVAIANVIRTRQSLDFARIRTMSMVASTSGSAIISTSCTRPVSPRWKTNATLVDPAWIHAAPSSSSMVTLTAPRVPLN